MADPVSAMAFSEINREESGRVKKGFVYIGLVLALAACQREGVPPPAPAPKPAIQATSSPLLTLAPATLSACQPGSVVTASWDASSIPDTTTVQLWVVDNSGEKLFAAGGAVGSATTGEWVTPGTRFRLKIADGSQVAAEVSVGGPGC